MFRLQFCSINLRCRKVSFHIVVRKENLDDPLSSLFLGMFWKFLGTYGIFCYRFFYFQFIKFKDSVRYRCLINLYLDHAGIEICNCIDIRGKTISRSLTFATRIFYVA